MFKVNNKDIRATPTVCKYNCENISHLVLLFLLLTLSRLIRAEILRSLVTNYVVIFKKLFRFLKFLTSLIVLSQIKKARTDSTLFKLLIIQKQLFANVLQSRCVLKKLKKSCAGVNFSKCCRLLATF